MDAVKLLGGLLGNKSLSSGLGGQLLGGLLGGSRGGGGGGMASVLGSVLGGGSQSGAGGLLGGLLGGGSSPQQSSGGGIGGLLGAVLGGGREPEVPQEQRAAANDQAKVLIKAMVNAAKSDGRIDAQEQENIISKLGEEVSEGEIAFLRESFAEPLDVAAFARAVPSGLEQQVYFLSLTSIELDTQNEAQYLGQLAQALRLDPEMCNQIHDHVKAPRIFAS